MYLKVEKATLTTQYAIHSTYQPPALKINVGGNSGYLPLTTNSSASSELKLSLSNRVYYVVGQHQTTTTTCYTSGLTSEGMSDVTDLTMTTYEGRVISTGSSTFVWITSHHLTSTMNRSSSYIPYKSNTDKVVSRFGKMSMYHRASITNSTSSQWTWTTSGAYSSTIRIQYSGRPVLETDSFSATLDTSTRLRLTVSESFTYNGNRIPEFRVEVLNTSSGQTSSISPGVTVPASMWGKSSIIGQTASNTRSTRFTYIVTTMRAESTSSTSTYVESTFTDTTAYSGVTTVVTTI